MAVSFIEWIDIDCLIAALLLVGSTTIQPIKVAMLHPSPPLCRSKGSSKDPQSILQRHRSRSPERSLKDPPKSPESILEDYPNDFKRIPQGSQKSPDGIPQRSLKHPLRVLKESWKITQTIPNGSHKDGKKA